MIRGCVDKRIPRINTGRESFFRELTEITLGFLRTTFENLHFNSLPQQQLLEHYRNLYILPLKRKPEVNMWRQ
jgi:hypothetical protein